MALPVLEKTWIFVPNIALPSTGSSLSDHQILMWMIKTQLVNTGQFRVISSSDAATWSTSDLWAAPSSLNWTGTGAWIVLERVATPSFQIVVDLTLAGPAQYNTARIFFSFLGFAGGSEFARPTALDETPILPVANTRASTPPLWKGGVLGPFSSALHYMYSTDGRAQRFFLFQGGTCRMLVDLGAATAPTAGWNGTFGIWRAGATYQILNREWCGAAIFANAPWQFSLATEGYGTQALGERLSVSANELDAAYQLTPAVICSDYPGARGRHGVLPDLWFSQVLLNEGDMYPADDSRQLVTVGDVVVPWGGDGILLTL